MKKEITEENLVNLAAKTVTAGDMPKSIPADDKKKVNIKTKEYMDKVFSPIVIHSRAFKTEMLVKELKELSLEWGIRELNKPNSKHKKDIALKILGNTVPKEENVTHNDRKILL